MCTILARGRGIMRVCHPSFYSNSHVPLLPACLQDTSAEDVTRVNNAVQVAHRKMFSPWIINFTWDSGGKQPLYIFGGREHFPLTTVYTCCCLSLALANTNGSSLVTVIEEWLCG